MATDLRSGHDYPRRAREPYGGYLYLLRVFDKARAARNGTIHDYIYPCPIDQEVFGQWAITSDAFDAALETCATDEQILAWLQARVTPAARDAAHAHLAAVRTANMDKHDREEAAVPA